jgi:dihydropteroate synthase
MGGISLSARGRLVPIAGSLIMGVVNASIESFSDAGEYRDLADRIRLADKLIADGADVIDVGGQSLSGSARELTADEETSLVVPIIESVAKRYPQTLISVDTYKTPVAEAAVAAGAAIVNDVSGLRDPDIARVCSESGAALVIAHMVNRPKQGTPDAVDYADVVADVVTFLNHKVDEAVKLGVARDALILDPGPDFSKTPAQTIEVIRRVDEIRRLGCPLMLPVSRKDFLGAIIEKSPRGRDAATMAVVALTAMTPGNIYRVHDVAAAVDVLKVVDVMTGRTTIRADYRLPDELRREPPVHT